MGSGPAWLADRPGLTVGWLRGLFDKRGLSAASSLGEDFGRDDGF